MSVWIWLDVLFHDSGVKKMCTVASYPELILYSQRRTDSQETDSRLSNRKPWKVRLTKKLDKLYFNLVLVTTNVKKVFLANTVDTWFEAILCNCWAPATPFPINLAGSQPKTSKLWTIYQALPLRQRSLKPKMSQRELLIKYMWGTPKTSSDRQHIFDKELLLRHFESNTL